MERPSQEPISKYNTLKCCRGLPQFLYPICGSHKGSQRGAWGYDTTSFLAPNAGRAGLKIYSQVQVVKAPIN